MATEVVHQSSLKVLNTFDSRDSLKSISGDDEFKKKETYQAIITRSDILVKEFEDPDRNEKEKQLLNIKSTLTWTSMSNAKIYNMEKGCMDTIAFWKKAPEEILMDYESSGEPYLYGFMYDFIFPNDKTEVKIPKDESFDKFYDEFEGEIRNIEVRIYSTNKMKKDNYLYDVYILENGEIVDIICDKFLGIHIKNIISLNYNKKSTDKKNKMIKKVECWNFKYGNCKYGEKCTFKH